jgi:hypothetical protein
VRKKFNQFASIAYFREDAETFLQGMRLAGSPADRRMADDDGKE